MAEIFISFRRDDTGGHAGRLRDHLRAKFGDLVFQDVDNIPDGAVFETVLASALSSAKVGVVVIGPHWLTTADAAGHRRLDDPSDRVRTEIRQLLARDIPVIPVLVGGVRALDAKALPDDLLTLPGRQIRALSDESWSSGVAALTARLSALVSAPRKRRSAVIAAAAGIAPSSPSSPCWHGRCQNGTLRSRPTPTFTQYRHPHLPGTPTRRSSRPHNHSALSVHGRGTTFRGWRSGSRASTSNSSRWPTSC